MCGSFRVSRVLSGGMVAEEAGGHNRHASVAGRIPRLKSPDGTRLKRRSASGTSTGVVCPPLPRARPSPFSGHPERSLQAESRDLSLEGEAVLHGIEK